jgi:hypothetical protein
LEFLSEKGNVIHGDISINNILINRVWDYSLEDSPTQLQILASNINTSTDDPCANDTHDQDNTDDRNDDNSMPKLGLQSPYDQTCPPILLDVSYDDTLDSIEAAGMLIDYDFMRYKDDESHQTSVCISSMIRYSHDI